MSARTRTLSFILASLPALAACSSSTSPTSPDASTLAVGSSSTTTSTGGVGGGGAASPVPTIVARVDSTTSVNNGTSYYPSWETVWYIGGHKLFAIVPTSRKSNATRIHSATGALVAGDCVTATYLVSGTREYAQDIKLELPEVCP